MPQTLRKWCQMHTCHLGLYQVVVAEALILLQEMELRAGRVNARDRAFQALFERFRYWCRTNHVACSQRRWTEKSFHTDLDAPLEYPWVNCKAFNGRVILAWCADALSQPRSLEAVAGADDWSRLSRLTIQAVVTIADFQNCLEGSPRYLTPHQGQQLQSKGFQFLDFAKAAAMEASRQSLLRWHLRPKMHCFMELCKDMAATLYNCRFFHNFSEEDFVGALKISARQQTLDSLEKNVLRNSLIRLSSLAQRR